MTTQAAHQAQSLPRTGMGCLLAVGIVVVGIGLLYWGYCWGWWMRDNLLVQALFQCNCPAASEAARYAPFEVLVSACEEPQGAWISPGQTQMLVVIDQPGHMDLWTIDMVINRQYVLITGLPTMFNSLDFLGKDLALIIVTESKALLFDLHTHQHWLLAMEPYAKDRYTRQRNDLMGSPMDRIVLLSGATVFLRSDYLTHPEKTIVITSSFIQTEEILPDLIQMGLPYRDLRPPSHLSGETLLSNDRRWGGHQ